MGRLELKIPLTEVIAVEEDRRRGLLRVVVEGDEYPRWCIGFEAMAVRVDKGSSLAEMGDMMMEIQDLHSVRSQQAILNPEDTVVDEEPHA